jgi:hypothetical protein
MKINSINSETLHRYYIGRIDVKDNFWADLDKVEKNLVRNGSVFPSFGARLEHICHDLVFYFGKGIRLIT